MQTLRRLHNITLIYLVKLFFPEYWKMPTHLVYAQSIQETGYFTSNIYRENKNLFGMKVNSRPYESSENRGHAKYKLKILSIIDYFARNRQFKKQYQNEQQYMNSLQSGKYKYAGDPNYVRHVMTIYSKYLNNKSIPQIIALPSIGILAYWLCKKYIFRRN